FEAEDGIRDDLVTGVQTCALPIFEPRVVLVDFSDGLFSDEDHAWLDTLDEAHARIFAAEQGYDLVDDNGMLTDWWGYCWMILAAIGRASCRERGTGLVAGCVTV